MRWVVLFVIIFYWFFYYFSTFQSFPYFLLSIWCISATKIICCHSQLWVPLLFKLTCTWLSFNPLIKHQRLTLQSCCYISCCHWSFTLLIKEAAWNITLFTYFLFWLSTSFSIVACRFVSTSIGWFEKFTTWTFWRTVICKRVCFFFFKIGWSVLIHIF